MKRVVLQAHPRGLPRVTDFTLETVADPILKPGEVLLKTLWLSLDPLTRFALDEVVLTGLAQVKPGEVVYGAAVSQVVESLNSHYPVGTFFEGRTGWQEFVAINPEAVPLRIIDPEIAPVSTALGVLGMPGQTAHACMIGVAKVVAGETVVISAAGSVVGSTAGQIGKLLGARVVGIAGSEEKCKAVVDLGFDACVDYKAPGFVERLGAACSDDIDVYIENVGGFVTEAVLPLLRYGARIPVCGYIAYYGLGMEGPGPDRLPGFMRAIMSKGLELRGFGGAMVGGQKALDDITGWIHEGKIQYPETIIEGLDKAPQAFCSIFGNNRNVGKLLVRVASPEP